MSDITLKEYDYLLSLVAKLNRESGEGVSFRLIEIKGTYFIHPQFEAN